MNNDPISTHLQSSLSSWELAGYFAFSGVIVCCLVEYLHVAKFWPRQGTWWTEKGGTAAALLLVIALTSEFFTQVETNSVSGRLAAQQNFAAAIADERLLSERRLTARERMSLAFLQRAVTPRSRLLDATQLTAALREGKFSRINLAILQQHEPEDFGMFLMVILQNAGLLGKIVLLPKEADANGLTVVSQDPSHNKLGEMLWQRFQIGGAGEALSNAKKTFPQLAALPDDESCLIVGEKDEAFQAMPGQSGEGLDSYGGSDPAPH